MAHSSTTMLQDSLSKEDPQSFSAIRDLPEKILASIDTNSFLDIKDKSQLFELSCILRLLGHACQNIDVLKGQVKRFELIYGLAQQCNQNIIDKTPNQQLKKDANWEMFELLYNTERFLLDLQTNEEDRKKITHVECKLNLLKNLEPYLENEKDSLRATEKLAQLENIRAIELSKIAANETDFQVCYDHICKAFAIANQTPNFNPFLLNMFLNNKNALALKVKKDNFDELSEQMNKVLEHAKEDSHFYNAIYYINAARLLYKQGKFDDALLMLEKAEKIASDSPENASDNQEAAKELRDKIQGAKNLFLRRSPSILIHSNFWIQMISNY